MVRPCDWEKRHDLTVWTVRVGRKLKGATVTVSTSRWYSVVGDGDEARSAIQVPLHV